MKDQALFRMVHLVFMNSDAGDGAGVGTVERQEVHLTPDTAPLIV